VNRLTTPFPLGLFVAAVITILDQASKWWIVTDVMQPPRVIPLTPFFNLVMAWNRGVSFGMFDSDSKANVYVLSGLALLIIAILAVWLWRADKPLLAIAIGMVIGGALGNVIDRLVYGAVADFLDLHFAGFHWPAFNVADSGICVGAAILILDSLFGSQEKNNTSIDTDNAGKHDA